MTIDDFDDGTLAGILVLIIIFLSILAFFGLRALEDTTVCHVDEITMDEKTVLDLSDTFTWFYRDSNNVYFNRSLAGKVMMNIKKEMDDTNCYDYQRTYFCKKIYSLYYRFFNYTFPKKIIEDKEDDCL